MRLLFTFIVVGKKPHESTDCITLSFYTIMKTIENNGNKNLQLLKTVVGVVLVGGVAKRAAINVKTVIVIQILKT